MRDAIRMMGWGGIWYSCAALLKTAYVHIFHIIILFLPVNTDMLPLNIFVDIFAFAQSG